jgi:hypothetical protein
MVSRETRCPRHPFRLTGLRILALEPERPKNRWPLPETNPGMDRSTDAQAACRFRNAASKRTPFFQTSNVIAAILRARVSRAIDGFIPLEVKAA